MQAPDTPANEEKRLERLRALGVLDTDAEARFDRITRIAADAFDVPVALVSLVDADRQWFKSRHGLDAEETGRDVSFCGHAINGEDALVVEDAFADERFADNPLVTGEPHVVFYAGMPLDDGEGHKLGTLCVIGHEPRTFDDADRRLLAELAAMAQDELLTQGLHAARRQLADREDLYRSVVGVLAEGLVVIDRRRTVVTYNRAAVDITGVVAVEGERMPVLPWVRADGSPLVPPAGPVGHALLHGEPADEVLGLVEADGTIRWLHVKTTPVTHDDDGRSSLVVIAFEDITEQIEIDTERAEFTERLELLNDELVRSNQDLAHFASIASHDLQTPVRNIANSAALLRDVLGDVGAEAEEYLGFIEAGSSRMKRLIEDLLEYSRVGRTALALDGPVALGDVVDGIVAVRADEIAAAGASVEHDGLPALVVDPGRIRQLLDNLVGNALKYRAADRAPMVRVEAVRETGAWTIRVVDNGLGVAEEYRESVFDMFRRLHRFEDYEGSGIGLAVCRRIAELHGGRIWVDAAPHHGSTFAFTIPDRVETVVAAAGAGRATDAAPGGSTS